MPWLWILLVIFFLVVLLCLARVGVWAAFSREELRVDVCFWLLRVHILPAKPQKPKAKKRKKKSQKPKHETPAADKPAEEKPKLPIAFEDIKDALRTLLPPLKKALRRARRGIRFKPLRLSVILGGQEDPAASVRLYGELQALIWTGLPLLEGLVDIRDSSIHTDIDFNTPDMAAEGEIGVTFRVGTLIAIGFGLAVPALKWFLRWRKRIKTRPLKRQRAESKKSAV